MMANCYVDEPEPARNDSVTFYQRFRKILKVSRMHPLIFTGIMYV